MPSTLLNRPRIEFLLTEIAPFLSGYDALYVYGGAGLILSDTFRKFAYDVDAYLPNKKIQPAIRDAACDIGKKTTDTKSDWLDLNNLELSALVAQRGKFFDPFPIYCKKRERVYVLKPQSQLALKMLRVQALEKDYNDAAYLGRRLNLKSKQELAALWEQHRPLLPNSLARNVNSKVISTYWNIIRSHPEASVPMNFQSLP